MTNHTINWVPSAHVCFSDLDFIFTVGGELVLAHLAIQSLPSIGSGYGRLECQPDVSLGPQPSREDPCCLTLSLECSARSTSTVFPLGLRNTAATASHLVAHRAIPSPTKNEFVGMVESVIDSSMASSRKAWGQTLALTLARGAIIPPRNVSW